MGGLGCPPFSFYQLTVEEAMLMIDGYREKEERDYNLLVSAIYNANGMIQGGKKFKPTNPFEAEKKAKQKAKVVRKEGSLEDRERTLNFLFNKFKEEVK